MLNKGGAFCLAEIAAASGSRPAAAPPPCSVAMSCYGEVVTRRMAHKKMFDRSPVGEDGGG